MAVSERDVRINAVRILRRVRINYPSQADGSVSLVTLNGGEVVSDPVFATWLATHVPQHVVAVEDLTTVTSRHCGGLCDRVEDKELITVVLRDSSITLGTAEDAVSTQFYRFRAGDVLSHVALIEGARQARIPISIERGVRCPHCRGVFTN